MTPICYIYMCGFAWDFISRLVIIVNNFPDTFMVVRHILQITVDYN